MKEPAGKASRAGVSDSGPDGDEVRLAEYRLEMGWTAYIANTWLKRGMPVARMPRFRGDDHIISRRAVARWMAAEVERLSLLVPLPGGRDEAIDFDRERARLTKEQADKTELENQRSRGVLVDAAAIRAALVARDIAVKDRLLSVPMAAADRAMDAARSGDARRIAGVYDVEIRAALEALASERVVPTAAH